MRRNSSSILIGLIFILLGIGFFIDQLGLDLGFSFGDLWPLLIILIGFFLLTRRSFLPGFILSGIGITFLVDKFTDINAFNLFWPLIIIAIGISILIRPSTKTDSGSTESHSDRINESILFWGLEKRIVSKNFSGGKVDVLFGGASLDLRDIELAPEGGVLDLTTIFGGIEIRVPEKINVESNGDGIFGGFESKLNNNHNEGLPVLRIKGSAIFGGVEVKN